MSLCGKWPGRQIHKAAGVDQDWAGKDRVTAVSHVSLYCNEPLKLHCVGGDTVLNVQRPVSSVLQRGQFTVRKLYTRKLFHN